MATTLPQDSADGTNPPPFSNTNSSKTSFDLEPNPFERSFATKENQNPHHQHHNSNGSAPNIAAASPQILTPGGRKLPPLVLSPNVQSSWSSNNFGRTGLTPNESGLRTGLTPGGPGIHSLNGISLPGLNTPGSLGFSGFTPGLSSLLGTSTTGDHNSHLGLSTNQNQTQQQVTHNIHHQHQQAAQQKAQQQQQQQAAGGAAVAPTQAPVDNTQPNGANANGVAAAQVPAALPVQNINQDINSARSSLHQSPVVKQQIPPNEPVTKDEVSNVEIPQQPQTSKRGRKKGSTNKNTKAKAEEESGPKRKKSKNEGKISNTSVDSTTSLNDEDDDDKDDDAKTEHMTEAEKRKHFLERNRVAASKCRQRKKQLVAKMETDLNFYLNEYNNLTTTIDQLKDQSMILRQYLINNNKVGANAGQLNHDVLLSVDNLLTIINQTNYMARLRGNAPSDIIPTIQPINPSLVQPEAQPQPIPQQIPQQQQQQQQPQPQQNGFIQEPQQQQQPQPQPQEILHNSLPNTVPNTVPNSVPGSRHNSSTNLQALGNNAKLQHHQFQQQQQQIHHNQNGSNSAPPAITNGNSIPGSNNNNGVTLGLF